jgi:phosphatidylglycerol:prolipoprotein diacylglycerol transferase
MIYAYPLFVGLSWGIGYRLAESRLPESLPRAQFIFWMFGLFLTSWIGAKVLFIFTQDRWAIGDLLRASNFWLGGGFVFLGGLIGGGLYSYLIGLFLPRFHYSEMNFLLVPLLWSHAVGRVGCFLAGCCYGIESQLPWAIELHGVHRHPTQLYEAGGLVLLAFVLNKRQAHRLMLPGYLLGYGVLRWTIECFRGDELRGGWGGQSTSQWVALLMIGSGVYLFAKTQVSGKT